MIIPGAPSSPPWQNLQYITLHPIYEQGVRRTPHGRKKILSALRATRVHTTHFSRKAGRGPNALLESVATTLGIPRRSCRAWAKSLSQNFEHGVYRPQPV